MLLVVDIGNTNIEAGLYDGDLLTKKFRISSDTSKTTDEYSMTFATIFDINSIKKEDIDGVIISSVVPKLSHAVPKMCERFLHIDPIIVGAGTKTGLNIKYYNPKEVGADRIVSSVSCKENYGYPAIIVDIGTAITFDYLDEEGSYHGGAIAPGIQIAADALFLRTSKLPRVELEESKTVIGKSTIEAMKSGLVNGYVGLIDGIIEKMLEELCKDKSQVKIISTGGFSSLLASKSKYIELSDTDLILKGLKSIYEKNV